MAEKQRQSDQQMVLILSIRKDPPDYHKLGRAFIAAAMREAEAEAAAEAEHAKSEQADVDAAGGRPREDES